jgi:hypothetical protein
VGEMTVKVAKKEFDGSDLTFEKVKDKMLKSTKFEVKSVVYYH